MPLLERARFLSIVATNLDEFLMIRVAGVKRKFAAGISERGPDGRTPQQHYALIRESIQKLLLEQSRTYQEVLVPRLRRRGIRLVSFLPFPSTFNR